MLSRRLLRIKVMHLLYAYFTDEDASINKYEKELLFSVNKSYDLYHFIMLLHNEIFRYADSKIEAVKNRIILSEEDKNPNTKFIDNKVYHQIRNNVYMKAYLSENKLSWVNFPELIKKLYSEITCSDTYEKYMSSPDSNYEEDKKFSIHIFEKFINESEDLHSALEDMSIYWNDDLEFIISMVVKTLKKFEENETNNAKLMPMFKNSDDKDLIINLFRKTIKHSKEHIALIEKYTKNWDSDRIAFMDMLILQMAITEAVEFPLIPIKVTINEYIDIAKFYSTNKSGNFINGVLDKIINDLKQDNKIQKKGIGLIGEI